ncbi:hypothetical protein K501DRAFT_272288 [Backusella circina FSU 941]|nr:hypothetical protein K501DRAFT_272288 [Backusella circina FSU 941]
MPKKKTQSIDLDKTVYCALNMSQKKEMVEYDSYPQNGDVEKKPDKKYETHSKSIPASHKSQNNSKSDSDDDFMTPPPQPPSSRYSSSARKGSSATKRFMKPRKKAVVSLFDDSIIDQPTSESNQDELDESDQDELDESDQEEAKVNEDLDSNMIDKSAFTPNSITLRKGIQKSRFCTTITKCSDKNEANTNLTLTSKNKTLDFGNTVDFAS